MPVNFKSVPFFRIILPYILGILACENGIPILFNNFLFVLSLAFVVLAFLAHKFILPGTKNIKLIYSLSIFLFLFILPYKTLELYKDNLRPNHYSNFLNGRKQKSIATIKDLSVTKNKLIKLKLTLEVIELNHTWNYCTGQTIVYVKDANPSEYSIGEKIIYESNYNAIKNLGNPNEFDFQQYLKQQNIFHAVFCHADNLHKISSGNLYSIDKFGSYIKHKIVNSLRASSLSKEAFSICSALIVGYDDEIETEIRDSFSHSGTLHLLAVSGLHTGVIYSILVFIFSVIDKKNRFKITRSCVLILCLWLFVLITGVSPSVMRAALMFSLIIIGKTIYKESNPFNTLFLSAFILLIANPYLIYNIGFKLSYSAVFGILYLYPKFSEIFHFKNKILTWAWNGASVSVAATLFTLPVSLFYFHQFPIWFVFSNLLIIPIGLFNLFAGIVLVVVKSIPFAESIISFVINTSTDIMLWVSNLTNNQTIGYIDYIAYTKTDVILTIVLILLVTLSWQYKKYIYVIATITCCIVWSIVSIFGLVNQQNVHTATILNIKNKKVYIVQKGNNVLINAIDTINQKDFERYIKPCIVNISALHYQQISAKNILYNNTLFASELITPLRANKTFLFSSKYINYHNLPENTTLVANSPTKYKNQNPEINSGVKIIHLNNTGALIVNLN